ncbi:MAG: apolipoprotein N-acyltransferase, partial [Deltaproteobacteria bacterium]|nr:apolipoprotein N-acyltransferase [Deltaproteobacteria bacterium]
EKWDEKFRFKIFERYSSLVQNAKQTNPDLIIWSETAAPFIYGRDPYETSWLNNLADETGIPMLVGLTADFFSPKEGYHLRNRLWLIYPMAEAKYPYRLGPFYDKKHLVPFGEYVPLEKTFPFLKAPFFQGVIGAAGDYSPGEPVPPLDFQGLDLGPLICFESVFPYLAREKASQGADLLVVSTNDAWFGKSYAPAQHFNHSIARAVETRKPLVRAANNGISGLIHPSGRVVYRSPLNAIFTIPLEVPVSQHKNFTWYTRAGWIIAPLTGIGVAFFLLTRIVFSLPFLRKSKTLKPSRHSTKTPHSSTKSPHSSTKSQASVNFKPSRKVRAPLNPNRKKKRKKR